jgi:hypothetical protein
MDCPASIHFALNANQFKGIIMDHKKTDKCAHPNCSCQQASDSKYCSPYCEAAKDTAEIACGCEHSNCTGKVA